MASGEIAGPIYQAEDVDTEDLSHDALSLDALIRREYGRIRRLAWRFGVPEDELDDATQEVFTRACAGFKSFRRESAAATWLTRVAINHFSSRRRAILRRLRLFRRHAETVDGVPGQAAREAEVAEAYAQAVACIRRLPVKLRKVFVLRYLEDMSCAEVAETLHIPEATVRTRAFHARKRLRVMMKGYEP